MSLQKRDGVVVSLLQVTVVNTTEEVFLTSLNERRTGRPLWRPVCIKIGLSVNYLGKIVERVIRVTQQPFIQVTYWLKYQSCFLKALTWCCMHSFWRNQLLNNQWPSPVHFCLFTFMNSQKLYELLSLTTLIILLQVAWYLYQNEWILIGKKIGMNTMTCLKTENSYFRSYIVLCMKCQNRKLLSRDEKFYHHFLYPHFNFWLLRAFGQ